MKIRFIISAVNILTVLTLSNAWADVSLPAVIGDNMVLQQETNAVIWGFAEPGESISIKAEWLNKVNKTRTDAAGRWQLSIKTPKAGGPYSMEIVGNNKITIKNILIGEVWICTGQSNMEWPISWLPKAMNDISNSTNPNIRLFLVKKDIKTTPQKDCTGSWQECGPDSIPMFSAVAYYYGRELFNKLNVPVGLISSSYGGSTVEAWMTEEALERDPDYEPILERMRKDFSFEKDREKLTKEFEAELAEWWKEAEQKDSVYTSDPAVFSDPDAGLNGWKKTSAPKHWDADDLTMFDGAVWMIKRVDIPPAWSGKDIHVSLGPADDMDTALFNGKKIGGMEAPGNWYVDRHYTIPSDLIKTGGNVIAVRVVDTGGPGGICGKPDQMFLSPSDSADKIKISLAGDWYYKKSFNITSLPAPPLPPGGPNLGTATVLYNAMIAPIFPYTMKGVIMYQGESNVSRAHQYRKLFPDMIRNWRRDWGLGNFPFYFVQIAPYNYGGEFTKSAELRESQMMALSLPNTGMAVTLDIGNPEDIHPQKKVEVGQRLALWAFAKAYGMNDIVYSGPIYKKMKIEKDKIRIYFDYTGSGLVSRGGPLTHFEIAGKDRIFVKADAVIDGNTVLVSSKSVKEPVAVRFAWHDIAEPNLFNEEGLPASSFRTDDWPGPTYGIK